MTFYSIILNPNDFSVAGVIQKASHGDVKSPGDSYPLLYRPLIDYETSLGGPEGYKLEVPAIIETREHAADYVDYGANDCVFTTQPTKNIGDKLEDFPDGWTECLIRGFTKREILSTPGFPRPIPRPPTPCHRIGPTASKGLGVFATRLIQRGDLIFSERAIMIEPTSFPISGKIPKTFTPEERKRAEFDQMEKVFEACFARLAPENKAAFLALHNSHLHDGNGPLRGIVRTNCFGIGLHDKGTSLFRFFLFVGFKHIERCFP